jgi:hypothetical protein
MEICLQSEELFEEALARYQEASQLNFKYFFY